MDSGGNGTWFNCSIHRTPVSSFVVSPIFYTCCQASVPPLCPEPLHSGFWKADRILCRAQPCLGSSRSLLWYYLLMCFYLHLSSPNSCTLSSLVLPFLICMIGLFLAIPPSFHFRISVESLEKHEVRTCWVCNLVLEIYNVLLYGEAISPQILFFFQFVLAIISYYSSTWSLESFCQVQRKKIQLEF